MTLIDSISEGPMRGGYAFSAALHVGVLAALVIGLPFSTPREAVIAVPMDLVSLDDISREVAEAKPVVPSEPAAEEPLQQVEPTPPNPVTAPEPTPTSTREPTPAPEPEPTPEPVQEAVEAQEPPPPPTEQAEELEPAPTQSAEALPETPPAPPLEPEPEEPVLAEATPPPPKPKPVQEAAKPVEPPEPKEEVAEEVEPEPEPVEAKPEPKPKTDALASILKNVEKLKEAAPQPSATQQAEARTAAEAQPRAPTLSDRLEASQLAASIQQQMSRCWRIDPGVQNAEDLAVQIRVRLNPDGSVRGQPEFQDRGRIAGDALYRSAAENARRAILECQPFDLPAPRYDLWQDMILTFNPREMF